MKQESQLRNEDGTVLVVALMMLVLLTLLGISISSTSEVELQIAGNEMRYKENLYRADAAAMACAQIMEETTTIDMIIQNDYIIPFTTGQTMESQGWVYNDNFWDGNVIVGTDTLTPGTVDAVLDPDGNSRYVAVYAGVPPGEDFESGLREFTIFGRSTGIQGSRSIIRMGYRRVGGIAE
ncbi:MAG: hypothetical protein JW896_15745 [Deltaproteobacteria bacterium]|nr:hypothetical protein [Deltaproteobacteria bacterium]